MGRGAPFGPGRLAPLQEVLTLSRAGAAVGVGAGLPARASSRRPRVSGLAAS